MVDCVQYALQVTDENGVNGHHMREQWASKHITLAKKGEKKNSKRLKETKKGQFHFNKGKKRCIWTRSRVDYV